MKYNFVKKLDRYCNLYIKNLPKKKVVQKKIDRILVIKLSAMGDAICLMPSLRILSKQLNIKVDWLTTKKCNPELFKSAPFLGNVYSLRANPFSLILFILKYRLLIGKYNLVIDFDQYYSVSEIISYFIGETTSGFLTPLKGKSYSIRYPYEDKENEKKLFYKLTLNCLKELENFTPDHKFNYLTPEILNGYLPSDELKSFLESLPKERKNIVIYPGSGPSANFRRWPIKNFLEIANKLNEKFNIIICGGPDEIGLSQYFKEFEFNQINLWSLLDWAYIFRETKPLFIGNDAGMLHLADSQGATIYGIFGPNIYEKWGSLNPKSKNISNHKSCRPCIKTYLGIVPKECVLNNVECLNSISPEQLLREVELDR